VSGGADVMAHRAKWLRCSVSVRPRLPTSSMSRSLKPPGRASYVKWSSPQAANWRASCASCPRQPVALG
jgi:hypothetical protein